ncbi:MAG: hypothetical protein PT977_02195 [Acidobacteriota bacterium]|nr:hypothetical protein [Acidobacteriota bacterium]
MRAVREAFERRLARGQAGKISSLAYCASAVEERWAMERRGLVGKEDVPPAAAADAAAIRETLETLASALRNQGHEKAAAKIDAIPSEGPFEEIEKQLSAIEASLVRSSLKAMNASSLSLVESRVDSALGDTSGLAPRVVERMRAALTRREVRALAGFPPLTLLHG